MNATPSLSEEVLWEAFRRALERYQRRPQSETAIMLRRAHAAFVRAFCPESAETEIVAFAKRLEGGDIAA